MALTLFNSLGKIKEINKLTSKLNSFPIFINDSIIYLNNKNNPPRPKVIANKSFGAKIIPPKFLGE